MYSVSENYANKIIADDRSFAVRLTFNSSTELTGTTIQNIAVDEIVNSADVLTLGCACSHKIVINLIDAPTDIDYGNSFFTATIPFRPISLALVVLVNKKEMASLISSTS